MNWPTCIPYIPEHSLDDIDPNAPLIQNMVTVIQTDAKFNETALSNSWACTEFIRHKFAAMTMRPMDLATTLLYKTGRMITVGMGSELGARIAGQLYISEFGKLRKRIFDIDPVTQKIKRVRFAPLSHDIRQSKTEVANTVYRLYFDKDKIFLDELHKIFANFVDYCPEAFPGARIHGKTATFLVYQSGCCLILGLSDTNKIVNAWMELKGYIESAANSKKESDILSNYLWQQSERLKKRRNHDDSYILPHTYPKKKTKKTTIQYPPYSDYFKNSSTTPKNKFEERLIAKYGGGTYKATRHVHNGISKRVMRRIRPADFSRCIEGILLNKKIKK